MIAMIDNYDSFTYNVYQLLARITDEEIRVIRNDEIDLEGLKALNPSRLIVSPGPGGPEEAGVSVEAIRYFAGKIPVLGVCLGHQAIAHAFGAKVVRARNIRHGVAEEIALDGRGLFRSVGTKAVFTRYHSLAVEEASLPKEFEVTARAADGEIMGIRHREYPLEGVQFHPESIASEAGEAVMRGFLSYRRENFPFQQALAGLLRGEGMDRKTAELFMEDLTEGSLDERKTTAILTALAAKGPSAEEIAGCAAVLCRKKKTIPVSRELTDIVGTGGDGIGTFNISSMAALVAAACGLPVAKHGNRAVSSKSGAADFYEALGFKIDNSPEKSAKIVADTGFVFLFAPVYHSAMRFAAPVRRIMGVKTIMNLVGPLSNPAGAKYQMIGVYEKSLMLPVARASVMLGCERVMVVSSRDGLDEISPCAPTEAVEMDSSGNVREYVIDPQAFGISGCTLQGLLGGDSAENARLAAALLAGVGDPSIREATALNAGAALYVSGKAETLESGYRRALEALKDGSVERKIAEIREASNG